MKLKHINSEKYDKSYFKGFQNIETPFKGPYNVLLEH